MADQQVQTKMKLMEKCPRCGDKMEVKEESKNDQKLVFHSCYKEDCEHNITIVSDVKTEDVLLYGMISDPELHTRNVFDLRNNMLYGDTGTDTSKTINEFEKFPFFDPSPTIMTYEQIMERIQAYWLLKS